MKFAGRKRHYVPRFPQIEAKVSGGRRSQRILEVYGQTNNADSSEWLEDSYETG